MSVSREKGKLEALPSQKKPPAAAAGSVLCLRCQHELDSYVFTRFTFLPYGTHSANVMLECPKCGHIEFMAESSPLLRRLTAIPAAVGDGD